MKPVHVTSLVVSAMLIPCVIAFGQTSTNSAYDPYFVKSTDTVSKYAPDHITRDLLQDKNGNFWFATWLGIIEYDGKVFTNYTLKDNLIRFHIICCYEDRKGNLWFGTARGGAYRYDGKLFTLFTTKDGLADNNIACITEDNAGNIWFGTEKGASRYKDETFTNFTAQNGLTDNFVNSIIQEKNQKLLFGTSEGLFAYDGKRFEKKKGLPFVRVLSLLEDRTGNLWIGGYDGLACYNGSTYTSFLSALLTYYIVEDRAGAIWLTHSEPNAQFSNIPNQVLYKYSNNAFIKVLEKDKQNDFQIFGKTIDRNGNVWFGTMHGPVRYDGRSFTYFIR